MQLVNVSVQHPHKISLRHLQGVCYTPYGGVNTPQFSYNTTPHLYPDNCPPNSSQGGVERYLYFRVLCLLDIYSLVAFSYMFQIKWCCLLSTLT